jgi:hypothetical protein
MKSNEFLAKVAKIWPKFGAISLRPMSLFGTIFRQ